MLLAAGHELFYFIAFLCLVSNNNIIIIILGVDNLSGGTTRSYQFIAVSVALTRARCGSLVRVVPAVIIAITPPVTNDAAIVPTVEHARVASYRQRATLWHGGHRISTLRLGL